MSGGFKPVQDISSNNYTGKLQTFSVSAAHVTLLAPGDFVKEIGNADTTTGVSQVDAATAGANILGAITSVDPNISDLEQRGVPALTAGTVKVAVDPNTLYEGVLSNGSIATTNVGQNADIAATAATSTGSLVDSNMTIDAGTFTAATAQVRIIGLKDGVIGTSGTVFVRLNESSIKSTAGV